MDNSLFLYISGILSGAAFGYGLPLLRRWRSTWPAERYLMYLLVFTSGVSMFIWSVNR